MKFEKVGLVSFLSLVIFSIGYANGNEESLLDKRSYDQIDVNKDKISKTADDQNAKNINDFNDNNGIGDNKDNRDVLLSIDHNSADFDEDHQVIDELLANENLKNPALIETERKLDHESDSYSQENNSPKDKIVRTNQNEHNSTKITKQISQNNTKLPEIVKQNAIDTSLNQQTKIIIKPGISEIIPISQGFINRIVTPFAHPEVVSSSFASNNDSCSEFCIRGNVVYINTNDSIPLSMFISEKDDPEKAFSVTLIPKHIPSREISFRFPKGMYQEKQNFYKELQSLQETTDYQLMMRNILRSLALNEIPEGYTMHETSANDHQPYCYQEGLRFTFNNPGLYFLGSQFIVYVGIVENIVSQFIEAQEISCFTNNVAAISFWPKVLLEPHDKSEVYVIEKIPNKTSISNFRPNLLRK